MPTSTRTIATTIHGRYLVESPDGSGSQRLLVGFHGYAESAARHLDELRRIPGADGWVLVAIQGLHRFYRSRTEEVIASWMTRQDRELAIADNVDYVNRVVAEASDDGRAAPLVFAGFSQGVAMAYRAAEAGRYPCAGLIALAGDVPPEINLDALVARGTRVLIGRGTRDEWYSDDKLDQDLKRLRASGVAVEPCVFDGGHEWAEAFLTRAGSFLDEVLRIHPAAIERE